MDSHEEWMAKAILEAEGALQRGEVPVGCIFVHNRMIIATGSNKVTETKNATQHAEMVAIDNIIDMCNSKGLQYKEVFRETTVYVTVEPCIMCIAALRQINIGCVVFGCHNERFGGCGSVLDICDNKLLADDKPVNIVSGVCKERAISLLKEFYKGENPNAPESKKKRKL